MVNLEVTWTEILVGFVLMPSARPRCPGFVVLDAELISIGLWAPLEFERCIACLGIIIEKDGAVERRHETNWTHRTRCRLYRAHV